MLMKMDIKSGLKKVFLNADVFNACLQHTLTTESEEVMGLLIGQVDENLGHSHIFACVILHRSEKQPDRVEISAEQQCMASIYAEKLGTKLKSPMRVLGWYHSHPHITVWPSHVDVRTQYNYQTMDRYFVGLIFSVFPTEKRSIGSQVQLAFFQSVGTEPNLRRNEIEFVIKQETFQNYNLENIVDLPKVLTQEEDDRKDCGDETIDTLTNIRNDAFKTISFENILSKVSLPMYESLNERIAISQLQIDNLRRLRKELKD